MKVLLFLLATIVLVPAQILIQGPPAMALNAAGGSASSLVTNLVSYWRMDESSGNRADSDTNGTARTLYPSSSLSSATGKITNAASFTGSEYLGNTNSDTSFTASSFTWSFWFQTTDPFTEAYALTKGSGGFVGSQYFIKLDSSISQMQFWVLDSTGTDAHVSTSMSLAANTWHFLVCWYDHHAGAPGDLHIQVDNGTAVNNSTSTAGLQAPATELLVIGADQDQVGFGPWTGLIDEVGVWSRALTSGERTTLYNSGSGKTYPFQ